MSIFSRNRRGDDEKSTEPETEELPMKPSTRPSAGGAVPSRPGPVPPAKTDAKSEARATEGKPMAELSRPADMARRLVDMPATSSVTPITPRAATATQQTETRKLTVGKEISLQGEINSCDHLVVEGSVGANLTGCREVEIMESGIYKGSAEIDQIEVRGLFEGTLHVRGRLLIRSTGKVVGTVRYGSIEIENGGQISGEIQAQPTPKSNTGVAAEANSAPAGIL